MKQRTSSIISEVILILVALLFLILSFTTLNPTEAFYRSAGFYPALLCGIILVISFYSLFKDLFYKKETKILDFGNMTYFLIIAAIMISVPFIWKVLGFNVAMFISTAAAVYIFHDKSKPVVNRCIFAVAIGAVTAAVGHFGFGVLLQVNF